MKLVVPTVALFMLLGATIADAQTARERTIEEIKVEAQARAEREGPRPHTVTTAPTPNAQLHQPAFSRHCSTTHNVPGRAAHLRLFPTLVMPRIARPPGPLAAAVSEMPGRLK